TSLQSFLVRQRPALAAAGLYVPRTGSYAEMGGGHHLLAWSLLGRHPDRCRGVPPEAMLSALADELAACGAANAVISSEEFSALSEAQIGTLRQHLEPFDAMAVLVLRRTSDAIEAGYRTHIQSGYDLPFAAYAAERRRDCHDLARRWSRLSATGDLRIGSYDDPDVRADVVRAVLGWLMPGMAIDRPPDAPRLNPGLPAPIIELARTLRREGAAPDAVARWLRNCASIRFTRAEIEAPRFMTADREAALDAEYAGQIDRIAADPALAPHVRGTLPRPAPRRLRSIAGTADALLELPALLAGRADASRRPAGLPRPPAPAAGAPRPGRLLGHFDEPARQRPDDIPTVSGRLPIAGWAIDATGTATAALAVLTPVDPARAPEQVVALDRSELRPDVAAAFADLPEAVTLWSGFRTEVDAGTLAAGRWDLRLAFRRADGIAYVAHRVTIEVLPP
uniref:hypothetical protein n=1 Tax=Stella sp. TaxID=2912054 RepID=UPI0035AF1363